MIKSKLKSKFKIQNYFYHQQILRSSTNWRKSPNRNPCLIWIHHNTNWYQKKLSIYVYTISSRQKILSHQRIFKPLHLQILIYIINAIHFLSLGSRVFLGHNNHKLSSKLLFLGKISLQDINCAELWCWLLSSETSCKSWSWFWNWTAKFCSTNLVLILSRTTDWEESSHCNNNHTLLMSSLYT